VPKLFNANYDGATNEVTLTEFDGTTEDPHYFVVQEDHEIQVQNEAGDKAIFNQMVTKTTPEQAVILFATMLGLREAAAE